ncbi:hypothetical protein [Nocardia sp. NPDC050175]|uniref:hypothetical protein n=1 Tax=Nocardia sp. NPDC050175 TaxID=3364317 RepID=UPI0037B9DA27
MADKVRSVQFVGLVELPGIEAFLHPPHHPSGEKTEGGFWVELKTIKQPTSTERISLTAIAAGNTGQIVAPGLILADKSQGRTATTVSGVRVTGQ